MISLLLRSIASWADPEGPSAQVMSQASSGVVQVIARGCATENRTGSGFLLEKPSQLVTALHVISGCQHVYAQFTGSGLVPATPIHLFADADLAMLTVTPPATARALSVSSKMPQVNETLEVIGYYFGVATVDSRPLRVTLGSPVLKDMITDVVRDQLRTAGSPKLSTDILRLDGNLLPGLSGAPLIDTSGGVVGIGSGGLENGTVGVSWAIQAHYLANLKNAGLQASVPNSPISSLFAAPVEGVSGVQVSCGDFVFAYVKTRNLHQLLATADDVPGLLKIAATTGMSDNQLNAIAFDIYAEQHSGGSVALPKGAHLIRVGRECKAQIAPGIETTVGSARVSSLQQMQQQSVAFEATFNRQGLLWQPDPAFTYLQPMTRPDGLIVRRKNFLGLLPPYGRLSGDTFETLMYRGTAFVGVRVTNTKYYVPLFQQCHWQPTLPNCSQVNNFFATWVAAGIGVQMSTFPPG